MSGRITSPDGTAIAFDRSGSGPAVVLVHGAFTGKGTHPTMSAVAAALAPWFTVVNYDRRGRGDSGDTEPYAVLNEVEDLDALIEASGGSAMVFGGSSGAGLALRAAGQSSMITKLALWEPPYHVSASAPRLPRDFGARLASLVRQGRRAEAVELFMLKAAEVPGEMLAAMRADPSWAQSEALAHTLAYEAAVMGPDNELPAELLATITQPTLVLTGGNSPEWIVSAGKAVAGTIRGAVHRVLDGQVHNVAPEAIIPELLEFFAG